ncbi:YraN family protein [Dactylosporangium sp. NPDC048998]|uniref:YraN family protein n=1 Tax=Dactylosporangium sp. NPDC048998 TaxID=3363976 RepID=UPI00371F8671
MTNHNQLVGGFGERVACRYLVSQGLVLLDRNWRSRSGELDVVARDGADLVFVEVKTRRGTRYGQPAEALVPAKVRRLRTLALMWLAANDVRGERLRFDVVSVLVGRSVAVQHLRGAF